MEAAAHDPIRIVFPIFLGDQRLKTGDNRRHFRLNTRIDTFVDISVVCVHNILDIFSTPFS